MQEVAGFTPRAWPNPSLHPKCNSWLRHLLPSGELKR
jgi:hypothetical protein